MPGPVACTTKSAPKTASRSRTRCRGRRPQAVASTSCRQTHAAVGCTVTLTWRSARRRCVMKNSTESVRNVTAGTVNRSAAQMLAAWLRRKVRQVWLGGRVGPRPR